MNKLEFINHSCIIISNKNISLAMDPWTEGSVFNNSWNLLVKTPNYLIENQKNQILYGLVMSIPIILIHLI